MTIFLRQILVFMFFLYFSLTLSTPLLAFSNSPLPLLSTESDPDSFVEECVNVISGEYCESATDLLIQGPDVLALQRFYSTKDSIMAAQVGGWRIFPQRFLVVGKDPSKKPCTLGKERFEWTRALTGERSGGILPYSGWRNVNGLTKDPLKIDILNDAFGMVNTYAKEMNGQTNHQNNRLHCKESTCELTLGDGTKRIYQKIHTLPSLLFGEEMTSLMATQVAQPDYFLLVQETLPSGNHLVFSYDAAGHLISVEIKNKALNKVFSWIHLTYHFQETGCRIHMKTSDARELIYHFARNEGVYQSYQLIKVEGSHCMPISYAYDQGKAQALIKKMLPEGRFLEIEYQDGKVKSLKRPQDITTDTPDASAIVQSFHYEKDHTDVCNAIGVKTRYVYDKRLQLTTIERYDDKQILYRTEHKFWGKTKSEAGLLLAKTIGDGNGRSYSYRFFQYDKAGNVTEERLYGNLTGKQEAPLQVSLDGILINPDEEECHIKTFGYSIDGLNLLTRVGDCKGNQSLYIYKPGTNLLVKKLIFDKGSIKKRTFQSYNEDGVCIKVIEDDGSQDNESINYAWEVTERHIKVIQPKGTLPGIGLPEVIEERALDLKTQQEMLVKKVVNTYDDQSNLLSCSTYDANDQYAFTEKRAYNAIGQLTSHTQPGSKTSYVYDGVGNRVSVISEGKHCVTAYDIHNQPISVTEIMDEGQFTVKNTYDSLGRKIVSIDSLGNATQYEYDAFDRLTAVIHPEVFDENQHPTRPTFRYTYDLFGNVVTIEDPKGFITTKSYNLRGDPTKITYPDGSLELFKYDTEGSLHRSLTRQQIITVYEYDYLGRSVYEESSTAGENGVASFAISRSYQYNGFRCLYAKEDNYIRRYAYDPAGRLTSLIEHSSEKGEKDPEARVTEMVYDSLSRLCQKKVWFDQGPQDYSLECFEYDLSGNIVEKRVEDAQGATLLRKGFAYDTQGHCTEEYRLENGKKIPLMQTHYNSVGEPICYLDGLGAETKIITDRSHQNRLGQTVLKKNVVNPIGIQTEIEFDALSRICSITKKDQTGILLTSQRIFYDPLGNKACEIQDQIVDGKSLGFQTIRWVYGPMGRLEQEIEAAGSPLEKCMHYHYNALGQVISKNMGEDSQIHYVYNKDGNLHKIEAQNTKKRLQVSNSYSYDRRGNIVSAHSLHGKSVQRMYNVFNQILEETIKDGEESNSYTLQYVYDKKGRLKEVALPDRSRIAYTYDAVFGRSVKRLSAEGEVLYTHTYDHYDDQGQLLGESHIGYVGSNVYTYDPNGQKSSRDSDFFNELYLRDVLDVCKRLRAKAKKKNMFIMIFLSSFQKKKITRKPTHMTP